MIEIYWFNFYIQLGISIVGGNEILLINIVIQEVYWDGVIVRDGRFFVGDQIFQVNNYNISNVFYNYVRVVFFQLCNMLYFIVF